MSCEVRKAGDKLGKAVEVGLRTFPLELVNVESIGHGERLP